MEKPIFQKNDALSHDDTTLEQRKTIHKLIEKRGYNFAVSAKKRDKHFIEGAQGVWNSHFAFEFERMEWRAISRNSFHQQVLNFYPYEWWFNQLSYTFDNSDSATDTMLDEQLEAYHAKTYDYDTQSDKS